MKRILLYLIILISLALPASAAEPFFKDVIVTSPSGIWTDTRAYTTLNLAVAAVGANVRTIVIPSAQVVTALTIPANVTLRFERDGAIANSGQLTIQTTRIQAGASQIFSGAGDIDFAVGTVVKSSWFDDLDEALDVTSDDTLTMVITEAETLAADAAVGTDVTLRWESPLIINDGGFTLSGLKKIEAGTYQIFAGTGDFDFLAGSVVHSSWFVRLRTAITYTTDEDVDLTILIDQPETIDLDVTADEYQDIQIGKGCTISVAVTKTLTIHSPRNVIAHPRQTAFIGAGTTVFTSGGTAYPEWWYDGDADWYDELNNATTSLANDGGLVQLSEQTYTIASLDLTTWINVPSGVTIQGIGPASIVYVADNTPDYLTIFAPNGAIDAETHNISFKNFRVDQNINNGTGTVTIGAPRHDIIHFLCVGSNIVVSGMTFDECSGVNPITINSTSMTDVIITDNIFNFVRQTGIDYDTTSVYINGKRIIIADNIFNALMADEVRTAIELHRGPGNISNNTIHGYEKGMYVVSESTGTVDADNSVTVTGNTILDANYGIALYAATGESLSCVSVIGNTVHLDQITHDETYTTGIWLYDAAAVGLGDFRDIIISDNVIIFEDEGVGRASMTVPNSGYGIGLAPRGDITNIIVKGNIIKNSPSQGIRIGQNLSGNISKDVLITDNLIINAGSNLHANSNNFRIFICVYGAAGVTMDNVVIRDNIMRDTWTTHRADHTIWTVNGGTITNCLIDDNISDSVDGGPLVLIRPEYTKHYAQTVSPVTITQYDCYKGYNDKLYSNYGSAGIIEYDLPEAEMGMKVSFLRNAGFDMHIDPNAVGDFIGAGGGGKYLILNETGEYVTLEVFQNSLWNITRVNSVLGITYEP